MNTPYEELEHKLNIALEALRFYSIERRPHTVERRPHTVTTMTEHGELYRFVDDYHGGKIAQEALRLIDFA